MIDHLTRKACKTLSSVDIHMGRGLKPLITKSEIDLEISKDQANGLIGITSKTAYAEKVSHSNFC